MRKVCLATLALFAVAVLVAVLWFTRTGTFSQANYERIRPGMSLAEVERLLGGPGTETLEGHLPGVVDWSVPVDHPKRVKAVVSGEQYLRWEDGHGSEVIISLRGGVVAEKWYWEPSL
jgi:hypothetical protein